MTTTPNLFFSFLGSGSTEMVTIIVGLEPKQAKYYVHKHILINKVPYFAAMFGGPHIESRSSVVTFPEDSCGAFDLFIEWVYNPYNEVRKLRDTPADALTEETINRILRSRNDDDGVEEDSELGEDNTTWHLADFYALAEKFCLVELQDRILDEYIRWMKSGEFQPWVPTHTNTLDAYKKTTGQRKGLRKFMSSFMAWIIATGYDIWTQKEIRKCLANLELSGDVMELLWGCQENGAEVPNPVEKHQRTLSKGAYCEFHVHGEEEGACYLEHVWKKGQGNEAVGSENHS